MIDSDAARVAGGSDTSPGATIGHYTYHQYAPRPLPAPGSVTAIPTHTAYPESNIPSGDG